MLFILHEALRTGPGDMKANVSAFRLVHGEYTPMLILIRDVTGVEYGHAPETVSFKRLIICYLNLVGGGRVVEACLQSGRRFEAQVHGSL